MVLITIVNGVYKPTYNWGAPHCRTLAPAVSRESDGRCPTHFDLQSMVDYPPVSSGHQTWLAGKYLVVDDIVPLKKGISIATFDSRVVLIDG